VTAGTSRLLILLLFASGLGPVGVAGMRYTTQPANVPGHEVRDWQIHEANVGPVTMRIEREADPIERRFYQAWLDEVKHDLPGAIPSVRALRADTQPGTILARDGRDGNLGSDPQFAQDLRTMVESMDRAGTFASR
jgi:hypothetical protein